MANTVSNIHSRVSLFQPTTLDIAMNKPDVAIQIMKKYSDQFRQTVGLDLALLSDEIPIASETHSSFSEGWYWETIEAAATSSASSSGGTQNITITVDSNNRYFVKVGHVIIYKGAGNIAGLVTAIDTTNPSAPVVTVQAASGVTLPAVTQGDELMISSSAWGEGTGQPKPSVKTYTRRDFHLQIVKDKFGITGSQLTNKAQVDISEYGGEFSFYNVGMADLDARMYRMEENALLLGSGDQYTISGTNELVDGESNVVQQTKGVIPCVREAGGIDNTVDASNWTITNLDDIDDYLKSQGDTSDVVMGWVGVKLARRINGQLDAKATYDSKTSALTQYIGGNGYDEASALARAVHLRYMEYASINRVYAFKEVASFSDPKGMGATGYKFNEYGIWFPLTNVKDAKSGVKLPLVSVMYKNLGGYSRRRELIEIAGAGGGVYNSEIDKKVISMRSHIGLAFHKPNLGYITTAGE